MSQRLTVNYEAQPCYDIIFSESFANLADELAQLNITDQKLCLVTDSQVNELYGDEVTGLLSVHCAGVCRFVFTAGEEQKTLKTVQELYELLIKERFNRQDLLIALGGGVVGDLTGFAAATYLRGVDFIQLPTTLLAQADSSIGGKTGVDFDGYKNMVGAFKMPRLVYMNTAALKTLSERQYYNGFAEIMKHGLIRDAHFYEWLLDNMYEICARETAVLTEMIIKSCTVKKTIVEKDPREQGERALLNFGHTIGHAIEKAVDFRLYHGECVALGAVAAAYISWRHSLLSQEEYLEVRDMFVPFNLPISVENLVPEEILRLTKADKKNTGDAIKFILLKKVGKAVIDLTVTDEDMLAAINEIRYREDE